jgi:chromosome condensin MukBEF MukE localization factor
MKFTNEQASDLTNIVEALANEKIDQSDIRPYFKLIKELFESCEQKVLAGNFVQRDLFASQYQLANTEAILKLITYSSSMSTHEFVAYAEKVVHMCKLEFRLRYAFMDFRSKNTSCEIDFEFGENAKLLVEVVCLSQ